MERENGKKKNCEEIKNKINEIKRRN